MVVNSFPLLNFGKGLSTNYKGSFVYFPSSSSLPQLKIILPKEADKNSTQNNPPQRSRHWLGTIYSVELAGIEGLKTACVLRVCQFCDS